MKCKSVRLALLFVELAKRANLALLANKFGHFGYCVKMNASKRVYSQYRIHIPKAFPQLGRDYATVYLLLYIKQGRLETDNAIIPQCSLLLISMNFATQFKMTCIFYIISFRINLTHLFQSHCLTAPFSTVQSFAFVKGMYIMKNKTRQQQYIILECNFVCTGGDKHITVQSRFHIFLN